MSTSLSTLILLNRRTDEQANWCVNTQCVVGKDSGVELLHVGVPARTVVCSVGSVTVPSLRFLSSRIFLFDKHTHTHIVSAPYTSLFFMSSVFCVWGWGECVVCHLLPELISLSLADSVHPFLHTDLSRSNMPRKPWTNIYSACMLDASVCGFCTMRVCFTISPHAVCCVV